MKKILITVIIIAVLIAAGIVIVKHKQKEIANLPKAAPQPMTIQTSLAGKGSLEILSHQIGEIQPYARVEITPRITGQILSITKREGDSVKKNEVVCEIDDRELADRLASAQAEASAARQRLLGAESVYETQRAVTERDEKLFTSGAISKEALERSRAAVENARASAGAYEENIKGLDNNAAALRVQSEYTKLMAPFSGIVTKRLAEPGDLAIPGKAVLVIEQNLPVKVTAQVSQDLIKGLEKGTRVYLSDGTERMESTVTRIYPALGKNFMGSIEMTLLQSPFGLPSGSTIGIDIVTADINGIIVPENAVVHTDKGYFIYLVDKEGTIRIRQVDFLGSQNGMTAVKGNLPEGSAVAVAQENRLLSLAEGTEVTAGGRP
jgi:RND family efflux transporter MFP subunit